MTKRIAVALLSAALALLPADKPDAAESLLQAATKKEVVDGNLAGAIDGYRKALAAAKGNRVVAAKALYQLGECYRKQGDAQARQMFERLVKEYGDQAVASEARARLAAMGGGEPDSGLVARRIWAANEDRTYFGEALSSDGRYALYRQDGGVHLHELTTGQTRLVSEPAEKGSSAGGTMISPDGRQIVYVREGPDGSTKLYFRNIDGSGARQLALGPGMRLRLWSWSPDGKNLLASLIRGHGGEGLSSASGVLLAVADGSTRTLPWNPTAGRFSPDGRHVVFVKAVRQPANRAGDLMLASLDGGPATALVENAVGNRDPVWAPAGDRVLFFSDRRERAELWSIKVVNGRAGGPPELVREDAGAWVPVGMTRSGDYYYMSHSYTGDLLQVEVDPLSGRAASQPVAVTSRNTIFAPAWSPDGEWLAYYREPGAADKRMYRDLVLRSARSGEERVVTPRNPRQTRPLLQWHPEGRSVLIDVQAALFRLDVGTGEEREFVKEMESRKTLAPDGRVVYSSPPVAGGAGWRILRRDLESGEEKQLCKLDSDEARGVSVSPDGLRVAFVTRVGDQMAVMTVPAGGGEPRELYRSADLSLTQWGSYTVWGQDGRRVFFTAAEGKSGHEDIFSVPAEGGPAQALGVVRERVGGISLHPDGRRMAYVERQWRSELWVLKNLLKPAR